MSAPATEERAHLYGLPVASWPEGYGPLTGRRWVLAGVAPVDLDVLGAALSEMRIDQTLYSSSPALLLQLWEAITAPTVPVERVGDHLDWTCWREVGGARWWLVDHRWARLGDGLQVETWGQASAHSRPDGRLIEADGVRSGAGGIRFRQEDGLVVGLLLGCYPSNWRLAALRRKLDGGAA